MGKTWKKRDGHGKHVNNKKSNSYNEFYDYDNYSKNTYDNSKNNHRSMKKAKEQRQKFEDSFTDIGFEF
jgi:hypothetical protein